MPKLNTTTSGIITATLTADSSPALELQQNGVAIASYGNIPAFSVYQSSAQSLTNGVVTKVQLQSEEFDTNNNFDSTTNYRFTPTVAGYYQLNGTVTISSAVDTAVCISFIYKNGAEYKVGSQNHASTTKAVGSSVNVIVYFNGSTDYVELYVYQDTGTSRNTSSGLVQTYFTGVLVRAA